LDGVQLLLGVYVVSEMPEGSKVVRRHCISCRIYAIDGETLIFILLFFISSSSSSSSYYYYYYQFRVSDISVIIFLSAFTKLTEFGFVCPRIFIPVSTGDTSRCRTRISALLALGPV